MRIEVDRDARSTTARRRGKLLASIVIGAALLLVLAACAPTAPAAEPTTAPAATAAPKPTDKPAPTEALKATEKPAATEAPQPTPKPATAAPAATATEAPKPTEKPAATATQAPAAKDASVSFTKDVLPILQQNCVKCHGGDKTEASLVLKDYAGITAGSENGPVVVSGKASESELVKLVVAGKMPKRANKLPDAQIKILTDWVNAGAPNN